MEPSHIPQTPADNPAAPVYPPSKPYSAPLPTYAPVSEADPSFVPATSSTGVSTSTQITPPVFTMPETNTATVTPKKKWVGKAFGIILLLIVIGV